MYFDYTQYKQKGQVPVLILVGILLIAAVAGGAYYLGTKKPATITPSPITDTNPVPNGTGETVYTESDRSANWKTYTGSGINASINFKYPPSTDVEVYKYTTQLYVGYTNQEWFNKINDLKVNESFSDQREKRTKLSSGKVDSSQNYVIFRDESSDSAQSENFNYLKAYILDDQTIVQIILSEDNIEVFDQILSTFSFLP